MQWDGSDNAGFSQAKPWLPVPPSYKTHNVAVESKEPDSVLEFYKKVLKLRHGNQALLDGSYQAINEDDANVLSYLRVYKDQMVVVVALNMSGKPQTVNLGLKQNGFASAKTLVATGKSSAQGDKLSLEPYGVFIGELTK
jgi:alpha-glucosidase